MSNPHETANRAKKVARLVSVLQSAGTGSPVFRFATILKLSKIDWARAALLAGCPPASATTRHDVAVEFARAAILDRGAAIAKSEKRGQWESLALACNELTTGEPGCPALDAYQQIVADVADETRRSA